MRKVLIACVFCLLTPFVFAGNFVNPDTVVTVSGKVVSEEDNSPLKAVIAYKKLPYGSVVGEISSNENGEYTIYVYDNASYSFTVSSEGYFAHMEELKVETSQNLTRDVALSSGAEGYVFTLNNLIFELGSADISAASYPELDMLVDRLNQYPNMEIQLEGHTDVQGNADANMKLSEDRVQAVKQYLANKGVSSDRIKTRSFGGTKPLSTEDTPDAHARNRRVEVRILRVE